MKNITFVVFTFNEEKRIGAVVRNLINYGDVLVLDDGSTDRTQEITESLGARFARRPKTKIVYVENREMYDFILTQVKTDWIFWNYADNFAPKSLLEKLAELSRQDKIKYVNIPIFTYLWGEAKKVAHKSYSPRFFRREVVDFSGNSLHGMGKCLAKPEEIMSLPMKEKYALRHYSLYNTEKFVLSHLRYADWEAQGKFKAGKKFSRIRLLAAVWRYFWLYYKNGRKNNAGLFVALLYSCFRVMTYARLYELENNLTLEKMAKNYARASEELLKDV